MIYKASVSLESLRRKSHPGQLRVYQLSSLSLFFFLPKEEAHEVVEDVDSVILGQNAVQF